MDSAGYTPGNPVQQIFQYFRELVNAVNCWKQVNLVQQSFAKKFRFTGLYTY